MPNQESEAILGYELVTVGTEQVELPIYAPDAIVVGSGDEQRVFSPAEYESYMAEQEAADSVVLEQSPEAEQYPTRLIWLVVEQIHTSIYQEPFVPVINIEVLQDILGGTEVVDAHITATVNRASIDAYRIDNQFVIFPRDIVIPVVDGIPTVPFVLTTLPPSYYWHIDVFVNGEAPVRRTVIVPDGDGPFDFEDLVDVTPETALPDPNTEYAAAYLAQIEAAAARAEDAANQIPSNIDGGVAASIYTPNQTLDGGQAGNL